MLSIGILLFALAYGVYGYFASSLTLGGVTSIIGLISILMPSIVELAVIPFRWSEARVALDRVSELLEEVPLGAVSDTMLGPIRMIDFEKVSYGYGADSIMLQDISLHIESGVLFGLTGESGSGKSTLCKLLERSYTPCSGSYMVNGIPAGNFAPEPWAARVAVVAQDVYILNGSLLENICLLVDSVQEAERAVELCRRYDFERFFQRFPQGYATLLGESGRKLSGGEKQLIALARALVCQPDFLILDEPTASMDPGMEQFVMNLLTEYKRNSIVLMVSHKSPLLLKYADYAGVLENGRLVCVGTPADLVSSDNFFSRFLQQ